MKYLTTFFLCSVFFISAFAQIEKGTILAGIQGGGYYSDSVQDQLFHFKSQWGYNTTFAFGKATSQNVVMGFQLSYGHSKSDDRWTVFGFEQFEISAGFYRRYYHQLGKGIYIWLQNGLNYSRQWQVGLQGRSWGLGFPHDYWGNMFSLVAYPGLSYSVNKNIQLEASYRDLFSLFTMNRTDFVYVTHSPKIYSKSFGLQTNKNLPLAWQLGIRILLASKNK